MRPLLEFVDIRYGHPGRDAVLSGVSFSLEQGERLAVRGRNGAGKTTMLQLAVGLLKPVSGIVRIFGEDRIDEAAFQAIRTRCGLVFQDPDDQLFSPTVLEDVAFGPLNQGKSRQEAISVALETLRQLKIEDFADRITYRLSGGEKRLVSLAAVLAMRPEILLLDEPNAGLDEIASVQLVEILASLSAAMIVVSHDAEFRDALATRTVVLAGGRIIDMDG